MYEAALKNLQNDRYICRIVRFHLPFHFHILSLTSMNEVSFVECTACIIRTNCWQTISEQVATENTLTRHARIQLVDLLWKILLFFY